MPHNYAEIVIVSGNFLVEYLRLVIYIIRSFANGDNLTSLHIYISLICFFFFNCSNSWFKNHIEVSKDSGQSCLLSHVSVITPFRIMLAVCHVHIFLPVLHSQRLLSKTHFLFFVIVMSFLCIFCDDHIALNTFIQFIMFKRFVCWIKPAFQKEPTMHFQVKTNLIMMCAYS